MNIQHVEFIIEEQALRSYALYVQRCKRRAEQANDDYAEALNAYDAMAKALRTKLEDYYHAG